MAPPVAIGPSHHIRQFELILSPDEFSRLQQHRFGDDNTVDGPNVEARYFDGALRYRFRLYKAHSDPSSVSPNPPPESRLVFLASSWPDEFYLVVNSKPVWLRRKHLWGKDLPAEITPHLVEGVNKVQVMWPMPANGPSAGAWFVWMETIETRPRDVVHQMVQETNAHITTEQVIAEIKRRLGGGGRPTDDDDDDDVIAEPHSINVKITDPFSFHMCRVSVRGAGCQHLECFDLDTWLETREGKPVDNDVQPGGAKNMEPSHADKWACPICLGDARPVSLQVDDFMDGVCRELRARGLERVKQICLGPDGSWKPVIEKDDEDDDDDDNDDDDKDTDMPDAAGQNSSAARRAMVNSAKNPVIIEDDD